MRTKLEGLRTAIARFISERESLVLVVCCSDPDAALVSKIVESLDESSSSELFWLIVDEFKDPFSFVEACVLSFATKYEAVRLALVEAKQPPQPPLPANIAEPGRLAPVERLQELIKFSRSLLPTLAGCGVVWALLPMKIEDALGYADFMTSVWQHRLPFPWCHHVRMIVRDSFPDSSFGRRVEAPRVQVIPVDFSSGAIRQALEEEADDEHTPLAERVNCALLLAGMDYSHGQYERAIQQYDIVHRYAAATENQTLSAIALNGMGEVSRAAKEPQQAANFFYAALAPAAQAKGPPVPVLLNLYLNLGELCYSEERWEEAEVYLQHAAGFALLLRDPGQRLRCWGMVGEAQYRQRKIDVALQTWSNGAIVAGKLNRTEDYDSFVSRVRDHYTLMRDKERLRTALQRIEDGIVASEQTVLSGPPELAASAGRADGIP
jgi:hypothetical protein